jgi:hypothetical protein
VPLDINLLIFIALFVLNGPLLRSAFKVDSNVYRPDKSEVPFSVDIPDAEIRLSLPKWNTNSIHLPGNGNSLFSINGFRTEGSYLYYAEVKQDCIEQLRLNFTVSYLI